jgi:hypothetical protein
LMACWVTSGPMPSPANTNIFNRLFALIWSIPIGR